MRETKRVMIADNSQKLCTEFADALKKHEEFTLVGIANDGKQAFRMIRELQPDVLVLEITLNKKDGISILKEMSDMEKRPIVITTSGFVTEYVASATAELGSRYLLLKPYDVEALIERMQEYAFEQLPSRDRNEMPACFEMIAGKAVRDMGIPANIKGYFYLIEAVKIAFYDKMAVLNVTKNIYEPVAEQFNTTAQRVSGGITRAITIGWDRCDLDTLEAYFGNNAFNTAKVPSNSEFITVLAENVRMGCEKVEAESVATEQATVQDPEEIRQLAAEALHELKVPAHLKGYQYLVDAITLAVDDIDLVNALYKVLYPVVAKHFNTTPGRVENAIHYAINTTWDLGDLDAIQRRFGYTVSNTTGKPTNGEFIAQIADGIQRRMKRKN